MSDYYDQVHDNDYLFDDYDAADYYYDHEAHYYYDLSDYYDQAALLAYYDQVCDNNYSLDDDNFDYDNSADHDHDSASLLAYYDQAYDDNYLFDDYDSADNYYDYVEAYYYDHD